MSICSWYQAYMYQMGLNTDTSQTNGVVSRAGKKTQPLVNGNASVIDPPVTIRQEPTSPVKVSDFKCLQCLHVLLYFVYLEET